MSTPLASDRDFRRCVRAGHGHGPRVIGEVIAELAAFYPDAGRYVLDRLEHYADVDPDLIRLVRANDWLEPAAVVRLVSGGRA